MGDLTKHFSSSEFDCPCCGAVGISDHLVEMLQKARDTLGAPIVISSGYRCSKHNKEVGGDAYSSHLYGYAADIACSDPTYRHGLVGALLSAGVPRIIGYDRHVHVDIDSTKDQPILIWGK